MASSESRNREEKSVRGTDYYPRKRRRTALPRETTATPTCGDTS
jgi:hypothetical protein